MKMLGKGFWLVVLVIGGMVFSPRSWAHCDTLVGPVIQDAKRALEGQDVTQVLKWVKPEREAEVTAAFLQAQQARGKNPQARDTADLAFFNILVRVHREGEGAPFTGLKSSDAAVPPGVRAADHALEKASDLELVHLLARKLQEGVARRFAKVQELQKAKNAHVSQGREYVAAYVDYVHYVEAVEQALAGGSAHHDAGEAGEGKGDCRSCGHPDGKQP